MSWGSPQDFFAMGGYGLVRVGIVCGRDGLYSRRALDFAPASPNSEACSES